MIQMKFLLGSILKSCSDRKAGKSDKECCRSLTSKLSVNEEYKEAFRTNSYLEIRTKVEDHQLDITLCNKLSSPSSSDLSFHSHLLDPPQETLDALIQVSSFHNLLVKFFESSSEACDVCESLLECIQQIKINHNKNPLYCIINEAQFHRVHEANSDLLARLTSKRRRIRRKVRFFRFFKKLGGYSLVISHSAIVVTLLIIALHSILGVLAAPALLGLCSLSLFRKKKVKRKVTTKRSNKDTTLEKLGTQMDIAAKGIFILINDLNTLSRLAERLYDEIEHRKTVALMCVKSRKIEVLKEALKEFNDHEERFSEQLQELEEHLYLCFHTINRSRRLVLEQITRPSS